MGSFNVSCFVSNQTIAPRDKCIIFPVVQSQDYNPVEITTPKGNKISKYGITRSVCHPNAFFDYHGPMLYCTYDDYGRVILDNTESNIRHLTTFFNILSEQACDVEQGENKYHDIPFHFRTLYDSTKTYTYDELHNIFDKVWEAHYEYRLFVFESRKGAQSLTFAIMLQHTANYLINFISKQPGYNNVHLEQLHYFNYYMNDKLNSYKDFKLSNPSQFISFQLAFLQDFGIGSGEGCYINSYYTSGCVTHIDTVCELIQNYLQNNSSFTREFTDSLFSYFKDHIDHLYIHDGLSYITLKIIPISYTTQDYYNELGDEYAKLVNKVHSKIEQELLDKHAEEYGDDEIELIMEEE